MTITITYEAAGETRTLELKNQSDPKITQFGFFMFLEADGRLAFQVPIGRVVHIQYEDNRLTVPGQGIVQ